MPFPDHVFRHTPVLIGRVTPPDQSEMRFGQERFDELEIQAAEEGWPPGWRMDHDAREANRQTVLSGRLDSDLWVFAYGSLIWDPAVQVAEYRYAALPGWHRSFCMRLEGGRGTPDRPGLMAALDEGGHCDGLVFRIPAALVDEETRYMWRREMFSGSYHPCFFPVQTPQGRVEALTFVMDHSNYRYVPDLSEDEVAQMIAHAEGNLGPNFDYLDNLVSHLDELGLSDPDIYRLHARSKAVRDALTQPIDAG
ncbi:MAG: gamma-glutamylcyclotransferase [Paracoccaceae bacterium]